LLAEAQLRDNGPVALDIDVVEVGELSSPCSNHLQEPSARVVVLAVSAQVAGQVVNALGKECNLNLGRAGVGFTALVFGNDFCLPLREHMSLWPSGPRRLSLLVKGSVARQFAYSQIA